ncbi:hypothetical protein N9O61_01250 [Octadecabacter sp.]|nr:hypothetical protein [Octadecabacter sp.]
MFKFFKKFRAQDDGAVTVDWVVLTAAIVGLAVALIAIIANGATDKSTSVGAFLSTHDGVSHE